VGDHGPADSRRGPYQFQCVSIEHLDPDDKQRGLGGTGCIVEEDQPVRCAIGDHGDIPGRNYCSYKLNFWKDFITMHLVTLGDSWPFGQGVEKPYGKILADLLIADKFTNVSQPATSNEHQLLQLKKFIEEQQEAQSITAIFFLTSPHRCLFYDQGSPLEIYPWADETKGMQNYAYLKYLHSPEIEYFRLNQTVLALQRICDYHNIRDFYFSGWHQLKLDWPGLAQLKIWKQAQETAAHWIGAQCDGDLIDWTTSDNVIAGDCHPNQKGHEIIAGKLFDWISCHD
jgi:hypothetical protein